MNSSIVLVLSLSLAVAFAASAPTQAPENKEDRAVRECNATNPVQRNPRVFIAQAIASGENIVISQEEKCFLNCFLQKVKFLDENSNIRGAGFVNYTLRQVPEIAKYSNVFIASIYQSNRANKGIEDKCLKAFVNYYEVASHIISLAFAESLDFFTDAQKQIYDAVEHGKQVDATLSKDIKETLDFYDAMFKEEVKEQQNQFNAQSQGSHAESPLQQQASSLVS